MTHFNRMELLKKEFSIQKNSISFTDLSPYSRKQVWWVCDKGHEWELSFNKRYEKMHACPYCSNRKVLQGYNDLKFTYPDLAAEWHPILNTILPSEIVFGSSKKVWWQCDKGHEWEATIKHRSQNKHGCPYCSNRKVLQGYNDLITTNPEILALWHPILNTTLNATDFTSGSSKKVWWQCDKGHEWEAKIYSVAKEKTKCPICSNKIVDSSFNSLIQSPHFQRIIKEWDYSKNISIQPSHFTEGSGKKVWWVCDKGHEWEAAIRSRFCDMNNCPVCSRRSSIKQLELENFISTIYKGRIFKNTRTVLSNGTELDIYIPERKIAIEYNGLYWHSEIYKTKNYHRTKWQQCKEKGIQLIQIWEDDYISSPELVKRMLSHKLGISNERKIYARNTIVKTIGREEASKFLIKNHIQGSVGGSIRLALTECNSSGENIVAVIVLKKEPGQNNQLNILRFATAEQVVGGFTKLLKHIEKTYVPNSIITFSDNTISDGGLYKKSGFVQVKELTSDYMYIVNNERVHKFNYRLKRFRNDSSLSYEENLNERDLAKLNGLNRIWDAGKIKWSMFY